MSRYSIFFNQPEDISKFIDIVSQIDGDVDMVSGNKIVDAKSLVGVLALSKSNKLEIVVHSEYDRDLEDKIKPFLKPDCQPYK